MMYDFTTIMDRKGKDAVALDVEAALKGKMLGVENVKVKEGFSVLPMWVADMNFPTVPTVQEAIIQRAGHPAFGYFNPSQEYYDAIIRWHQTRNGVTRKHTIESRAELQDIMQNCFRLPVQS